MTNDNQWYENGELPPVGIECEALYSGAWRKVKILTLAVDHELSAIYQGDGFWSFGTKLSQFRPIKSDREKVIEAAMDIVSPHLNFMASNFFLAEAIANKWYDAGFLRLPEDK